MTEQSASKDRSEPGHAVLVAAAPSVLSEALDRQCMAFSADGLIARKLAVKDYGHYRELQAIARTCDAEIRDWHEDPAIHSITIMVWCPLASPLRLLTVWIGLADASMVRVFGPHGDPRDGCPDHRERGVRLAADYFDGDIVDTPEEVHFKPDNSPNALAWRRLCKALRRHKASLAATYENQFVGDPLSWLDLPLVNGHVLGEVDEDPRLT
jgi:hypothetical protein